ncbi:MAG: [FeFe] hydrogenase H-cluster radical SAM maturase HydG [Candidatus Omnitrophica bacterium CG11_big_fil_rev_8_21_14_0_20_41_12]|nr:MAG: [FeFe] hydrogenase H-cluster radical SAM maturase HydG [Candidatus Omnitrophica bacterium CG11_big_fil_rev_8_21_14_0_20_41_12]
MKHIDENKINNLLADMAKFDRGRLDIILDKARLLKGLSLEEVARLLAIDDPDYLQKIFSAANFVKEQIYGQRVVLFAPLYINNFCSNNCLYCAFRSDNRSLQRKALNTIEIKQQTEWLLERGHKRILMVSGEAVVQGKNKIDYYVESIASIYAADFKGNRIKRVNVNCAPLEVAEFKRLKGAGIGTYQLFQETYHEKTYSQVHPSGAKSDPDNRIDAIDRAFIAGIDDIGIGVLYGLYNYKFETLAMLAHVQYLEAKFKVGPHTISVPRIEPAFGTDFSQNIPYPLSDTEFKKLVAVLRLAVPYTGIIMSTRESAALRDELLSLGVSQISAESRTSPGGYSFSGDNKDSAAQFFTGDQRSLDEIVLTLIEKGFIPSFCAACYRKERTGEAFMKLAKPGTIKGKCSLNALVTLREYIIDFASPKVKGCGEKLIEDLSRELNLDDRGLLQDIFEHVENGARDEFV